MRVSYWLSLPIKVGSPIIKGEFPHWYFPIMSPYHAQEMIYQQDSWSIYKFGLMQVSIYIRSIEKVIMGL